MCRAQPHELEAALGTVIRTSDNGTVSVPGECDGVIGQMANALGKNNAERDEHGRSVPKRFMLVHDADGRETWVNTAQITRVESK
jgi:hypothetical protein